MKKLLLLFSFLAILPMKGMSQQVVELCDENQQTFTYNAPSTVAGNYQWFVDGNMVSVSPTLTVNWSLYPEGQHTITVDFIASGCPAVPETLVVSVAECQNTTMFAPNAFTPDGDTHNNIWVPVGFNYQEMEFMIFDRWGELIYQSYNGQGWDGTYKGVPCKEDVYVYKLFWKDNKNHKYEKYGHITLIR